MSSWPSISYPEWSATCDTLHAHTQVLGKLAAELAPPEPQLQHAALRLTARGWETLPLPSPDGTGAFVVALDLHRHEALVETTDGDRRAVPLIRDRSVGEVTRELLSVVAEVAGEARIDPEPQEVAWTVPLDQDTEHSTYEEQAVGEYFRMATRAAQVLAAFRAPFRGRSTPVNAWWGSFDLAVSLFSGDPAAPPSDDFIMRNAMDSQEVAVGWWPGDPNHGGAAFYAYAHPAQPGFAEADLKVDGARWDADLGEYVLEWEDVVAAEDPHGLAVSFARQAFLHACMTCGWDAELAASAEGTPPPVA
ncbi:MAG TPA: DUF5996 family protein [Solirubrobacterales bacterium]|nr:DUF5996 family protein [Solirubrobacterales bacterium]